MRQARVPTRLGQAILATLAELDAPDGRSQNEAARRARLEGSYVSKALYGRVPVGFGRLRRLAAANGLTEAQWQTWVQAKLEDQREATAMGRQLTVADLKLMPTGAPEVALEPPPVGFRDDSAHGPRVAPAGDPAAGATAVLPGAQGGPPAWSTHGDARVARLEGEVAVLRGGYEATRASLQAVHAKLDQLLKASWAPAALGGSGLAESSFGQRRPPPTTGRGHAANDDWVAPHGATGVSTRAGRLRTRGRRAA